MESWEKNKDEICRKAKKNILYAYKKALQIYTKNRKKDEDKALMNYRKECHDAEKEYVEKCGKFLAD